MNYIELAFNFKPLLPTREILVAELGDLGFESFLETDEGLKAYIQKNLYPEDLVSQLSENNWYKGVDVQIKEIEDQNWNAVWESNFKEVIVNNKCLIRANFHPKRGNYPYEIVISPQMSFGTGHHPTTKLMVEKLLDIPMNGKKVLDMGCGTGVLAIFCAMAGAKEVLAVDTDDWAVNNALENVKTNNIIHDVEVIKGSVEDVEEKNFDLIVANINKNVLMNHLKTYCKKLKPGGDLLLSGFYKVDENQLIEESLRLGFVKNDVCQEEDWSILHLKKTNNEVVL